MFFSIFVHGILFVNTKFHIVNRSSLVNSKNESEKKNSIKLHRETLSNVFFSLSK